MEKYQSLNTRETFESWDNGGGEAASSRPTTFASQAPAHMFNAILRNLSTNVLNEVRPSLRRVHVRKEEYLFHQDDDLQYVYFPESAVISEFHVLDDGRMVEVSIIGNEGAIGVSTLFCADKIANCVQVTQAGSVLKIEAEILRSLGKRFPELPVLLHTNLESYIRQLSQKSVCNMFHSVEERFCTWLLMVHDRCGREQLKLTHEQIARTLGVYRPSVTCIALNMRKKRLIDYSRGGISIRDRKKMEEFACGCYAELGN